MNTQVTFECDSCGKETSYKLKNVSWTPVLSKETSNGQSFWNCKEVDLWFKCPHCFTCTTDRMTRLGG